MINNVLLVNMMVVKNTKIKVSNSVLLINTILVWNKSPLNWYLKFSWKKKKMIFTSGLTNMINGMITPTHLRKEMKWGLPHI